MPPAAPSLLSVCIIAGNPSMTWEILDHLHHRYRGDLTVPVVASQPLDTSSHRDSSDGQHLLFRRNLSIPNDVLEALTLARPEVLIYCTDAASAACACAEFLEKQSVRLNVAVVTQVKASMRAAGVKGIVYLSTTMTFSDDRLLNHLCDVSEIRCHPASRTDIVLGLIRAAEGVVASPMAHTTAL